MSSKRDRALKVFTRLSAAVDAGDTSLAAERFNELCEVLGWGATEFSEKLNISDQSFYRWKKGAKLPRKGNLDKIERFLKRGELESSGTRLDPLDLGIQTWEHIATRAENPDVKEVWVYSAEEFLEARVSEARERMRKVILSKGKDFFYVFPAESAGASTWQRWVQPLKFEPKESNTGRVVGVKVINTRIDQFPMFIHGVYAVLYHFSNERNEGFLAFSVNEATLKLIAPQKNGGKHPDMLWMRVDNELANSWYDTYCRQIKKVFYKQIEERGENDSPVTEVDLLPANSRQSNQT